jgi:transcriptional regulator with XRE-family HTH domain
MDTNFSEWLAKEMEKREWTQSDLARKADINRQVISTYINRKRAKPDEEVLSAIARAFKMPPETVFRAAGLLPPDSGSDSSTEEITHIYNELNNGNREDLLDYARLRLQKQEREKTGRRARTT